MARKTKWRPEQIEVGITKGGHIRIAQSDVNGVYSKDREVVVMLDTDDVDQFVTWIQEVKAEILEAKANGDSFDLDEEEDTPPSEIHVENPLLS